jgi:hypothetical protein
LSCCRRPDDDLGIDHREVAKVRLLERTDHGVRHLTQVARGLGSGLRDADQHLMLRRLAVLLNHRVVAARRAGDRRAHTIDLHRLIELDDDDRAAEKSTPSGRPFVMIITAPRR